MIHSETPLFHADLTPATQDEVRTLPMLYRASREFALSMNNPVINRFLDAVPEPEDRWIEYESLDIKVCMLKKGWWPCIPGWHLDDFWRGENGQPALRELNDHPSTHWMALHGGCSLTQFVTNTAWPYPPENIDTPVYGWYNRKIEQVCPNLVTLEADKLYSFTHQDFHRGMPATRDGWRAFFRLTQSCHRKPKDEIRQQVQVYVPHQDFFKGW